jgi:hypothetical protein
MQLSVYPSKISLVGFPEDPRERGGPERMPARHIVPVDWSKFGGWRDGDLRRT